MLKKTVQYENFDGEQETEVLYFNITKTELSEHLDLQDRIEGLKEMLEGEKRSLSIPEVTEVLDLVKTFARLSYGLRSEDGKRFIKTKDTWTEFTQTAAYDAFLFGLFENPEEAIDFLLNVMPQDLVQQAKAEVESDGRPVPQDHKRPAIAPAPEPVSDEKDDEVAALRAKLAALENDKKE